MSLVIDMAKIQQSRKKKGQRCGRIFCSKQIEYGDFIIPLEVGGVPMTAWGHFDCDNPKRDPRGD